MSHHSTTVTEYFAAWEVEYAVSIVSTKPVVDQVAVRNMSKCIGKHFAHILDKYVHVVKQREALKAVSQFQRKKLSCLQQNLNLRSPAYMTGALLTKPPRQLS